MAYLDQEELFKVICFMQITRHPISEYAPDYLEEKIWRSSQSAEAAYSMLSRGNQEAVLRYCEKWRLAVPQVVLDYEAALSKDFDLTARIAKLRADGYE